MLPKYLAIVLTFYTSYLFCQSFSGKVIDQFQNPIHEAHILNLRTDQHTHTDEDGRFYFDQITAGDSLYISFVGFGNETVKSDLGVKNPIVIMLFPKIINLDEIVISPGVSGLKLISDIDIQVNPVNSSQDILRKVPGLFIGQHAGGGKAEQIFLRGFDVDHGTDVTINVDGMPVNMVSHAHGQGYADLHFVIPETIDRIDFGKGPYHADIGNFNTAGYVNFSTKDKLDASTIKFELGQFSTQRLMTMFKLLSSKKHNTYISSEFISTDGPFESPQNFNRLNLFAKHTSSFTQSEKVSIQASHFSSEWDASGQIPQRAVDSGLISRFGAIDDTEGGSTSRTNISMKYDKFISDQTSISNTAFFSNYDFELFSNFTFFLEDKENGDQIRQNENRTIYGLNTELFQTFVTNNWSASLQAGISYRLDEIKDVELSHTLNRTETLENIQLGNVQESNLGTYVNTSFNFGQWILNPSLRLDYFDFQYTDATIIEYNRNTASTYLFSPKFNLLYNPSHHLQLYLKSGKGFHSNDTRVVVRGKNKNVLPSAYGLDVGYIWKPRPTILINMAYWYLFLEQEFVYVGDAGIVEPSGKSRRHGIEMSCRYQPFKWIFWNVDANYTHARSIDEPEGEQFIPLAPEFTLISSIHVTLKSGLFGSFNLRHLGDRPANENDSITAIGYTVADLSLGYRLKNLTLGIQIQNLFDTEWNETQFATESRLRNELNSVEEIHFTPGTPFFLRASMEYKF